MDTPTHPALDATSTTRAAVPDAVLVGTALAAGALLAGCGAGGGGEEAGPTPPPNTIQSLTIREVGGASVTVNGTTGGSAGVAFPLDGSLTRPTDPGADGTATTYSFNASGTGGSAVIQVTLNPTPTDVVTAQASALQPTVRSVVSLGFNPTWEELLTYHGMTHAQIVDRMIARMTGKPFLPYPTWIDTPGANLQTPDITNNTNELKHWFMLEMIQTPDPLSERLLLFWHNLFTSAINSNLAIAGIARQHRTWREQMVGNFRTFVKAMSRDPAMVRFLNSSENKKGRPNENFARELMELFTLGERTQFGAYDESDIPVLSRAFTGYNVGTDGLFKFNSGDHDFGALAKPTALPKKTFFGSDLPDTADDGDAAIDLILARQVTVLGAPHSACGRYIVTRLWQEFIGAVQDADLPTILDLGDQFASPTGMDYDLKSLYRAFFKLSAFADASRQGTRIRTPVELFVGYWRAFGIIPTFNQLFNVRSTIAGLGQDLFDPETVFGWPVGADWIDVKTFVGRNAAMVSLGNTFASKVPTRLLKAMDLLLMASPPVVAPTDAVNAGVRARQLITDTAYNLR